MNSSCILVLRMESSKKMTIPQFADRFYAQRPREEFHERVLTALDLLFEARCGWAPGDALTRTPQQLLVALEHALSYDDPSRPSIWTLRNNTG